MIGNQWDPGDPPCIVGEAVAGREAKAKDLRKRIKILAGDIQRNTFDLAEAFYEAQETHCYLGWGFESLEEYAEIELKIKPRRAQYLARIARICKACGVSRADYEPAGVTNLRLITTLNPEDTYFNTETKQHEPMVDHIVRLIAEGPELSAAEVDAELQRLKGNVGPNARLTRSYNTTVSAYDNTIKKALEEKRKQLGSKGRDGTGAAVDYSDGDCFEYICIDWLNDPNNFLEETDESQVQIEIPEESNGNHEANSETAGLGIPKEGEVSVPQPGQPFVIQSEE